MGMSVNGSRCVLGQWDGQDVLIVVGGTTKNGSNSVYPGLQHFDFANKTWNSPPPGASVTQNRQMHGAAYLNDSKSILVYSGFQDDSYTDSSETFTISTQAPYIMQSFPSQAPPGRSPTVLAWNSSHGVMVGGSADNKAVWVFSEATGWQQIQITLPDSVGNMSMVQGSMIQGDGDSKALQLFNMTSVPNQVTSLLVQSGDDQPVSKQIEHGKVIIEAGKRLSSRQVNLGLWPAYNGSQAPSEVRQGFSLAQSNGLVVIAGGTNNPGDSVCMFNQTGNSWINASQFFTGRAQVPSAAQSSAASSPLVSLPTSTSGASAQSSTPASSTSNNALSDTTRIILGSVLGGLAGLAAILIILLLVLRYRKQKQRSNMTIGEEKYQMGLDDSAAVGRFGRRKNSNSSKSSSNGGFFSRTISPEHMVVRPQISNPQLVSDSTGVDKDISSTGPAAATAAAAPLAAGSSLEVNRTEPRDAGWSQYFTENSSNNALNAAQGQTPVLGNTASRQTAYSVSDYNHRMSQTALIDGGVDPPTARSSGYPQSEESWEKSKFHPQSTISSYAFRPGTAISHVSEEEPESFLNPASSSSGTQGWESLGAGDGKSTYDRRPSSSVYADSINFPHPGDRVHIPGVSDIHNSAAKNTNNSWRQPFENRGMRTMATKDFGVGSKEYSTAPDSRLGIPSTSGSSNHEARPPIQSDMSWLNLGQQ